nr:MAG TPA: hypothetical protein [Caudoviricetes sp.]
MRRYASGFYGILNKCKRSVRGKCLFGRIVSKKHFFVPPS